MKLGEKWTEEEYEEEAKRVGWTVEQLKEHVAKEIRIMKAIEYYATKGE